MNNKSRILVLHMCTSQETLNNRFFPTQQKKKKKTKKKKEKTIYPSRMR